jgi:hypothetical protein
MTTTPAMLPHTEDTPVLRTDFAAPDAWDAVRVAVEAPKEHGFRAYVTFVDDPAYRGLTPKQVVELEDEDFAHAIVVLADAAALASPEMPLLVVDLVDEPGQTLRVVAQELYSIENNLSIANMDFSEFADAAAPDGVFRGFR